MNNNNYCYYDRPNYDNDNNNINIKGNKIIVIVIDYCALILSVLS